MKKYRTGLVVGKFCPLHKGHEYLIETAMENCEEVIILSYTSSSFPKCTVENRYKWLNYFISHRLYPDTGRVRAYVIDPKETQIPNDLASDEDHRKFCADYLLNEVETTVQAVFSAEAYGQGFADYLTMYFTANFKNPVIVHNEVVDIDRQKYRMSGTMLRDSPTLIKDCCSNAVINSYIKKVLFLGGESSGKTTIVEALSKHYDENFVEEFGRIWYEARQGLLKYEDMEFIATTQIGSEDMGSIWVNKYLFCDTSALTTSFYSKEWFGRVSKNLQKLVEESLTRYDKIYVCLPDFPMIQDGTRQDEKFRMAGFNFVIKYLESAKVRYSLLGGTEEFRLNRVIRELDKE